MAASRPSGPFITASSAAELVTITKMTSAACATAFGDAASVMPFFTSQSAFDAVRLYPVTLWPLAISSSAMLPPIAPSPT